MRRNARTARGHRNWTTRSDRGRNWGIREEDTHPRSGDSPSSSRAREAGCFLRVFSVISLGFWRRGWPRCGVEGRGGEARRGVCASSGLWNGTAEGLVGFVPVAHRVHGLWQWVQVFLLRWRYFFSNQFVDYLWGKSSSMLNLPGSDSSPNTGLIIALWKDDICNSSEISW